MRLEDPEYKKREEPLEIKESEPVREMSFSEKAEYFWDYYKWAVIIPVIVIAIIVAFISSYINENKEPAIHISLMNGKMNEASDVTLGDDYASARNIDTEKTPVSVESNLYQPEIMDAEAAANESAVASIQKYDAMLKYGRTDVTITTSWVVEEYEAADAFVDLKEILPVTLYNDVEEYLFYAPNSKGEKIPVGITLEHIPEVKRFYPEETPIITISAFTDRVDNAIDFIRWLVGEEK